MQTPVYSVDGNSTQCPVDSSPTDEFKLQENYHFAEGNGDFLEGNDDYFLRGDYDYEDGKDDFVKAKDDFVEENNDCVSENDQLDCENYTNCEGEFATLPADHSENCKGIIGSDSIKTYSKNNNKKKKWQGKWKQHTTGNNNCVGNKHNESNFQGSRTNNHGGGWQNNNHGVQNSNWQGGANSQSAGGKIEALPPLSLCTPEGAPLVDPQQHNCQFKPYVVPWANEQFYPFRL